MNVKVSGNTKSIKRYVNSEANPRNRKAVETAIHHLSIEIYKMKVQSRPQTIDSLIKKNYF